MPLPLLVLGVNLLSLASRASPKILQGNKNRERRGLAVFKSLNGEHHVGWTFIATVWTAHPCRNEETRGLARHTSKVDRRNLTRKVGSVDIEEAAWLAS